MRSTVETKEIDHFSRHSADWWDESGPFRPLHAINPARLDFIAREIRAHFKDISGLSILDCGCGGGLLSEPMARLGARVTGIDADKNAIDAAKRHARGQKLEIDYRTGAVEDLKEKFDVVLALEIIEHVADAEEFAEHLARVLKPGGLLILSTLNRNPKSYLLGIIVAEYVLRWVPKGTHDWNKFLTPEETTKILRRQKLRVKSLQGIVFNPLLRTWSLSEDSGVNYILSAAK